MLNRRQLLKGLVGAAAGALVLPEMVVGEEAQRRYWALDRTQIPWAPGWSPDARYADWLESPTPIRVMTERAHMFPPRITIGDYMMGVENVMTLRQGGLVMKYDTLNVDGEWMWVTDIIDDKRVRVVRDLTGSRGGR